MPFQVENLPEAIRDVKKKLRRELPAYAKVFQEVEAEMRSKVAQIVKERAAGAKLNPVEARRSNLPSAAYSGHTSAKRSAHSPVNQTTTALCGFSSSSAFVEAHVCGISVGTSTKSPDSYAPI